ncbi:MAG TPA: type I-E CRISPR-associated protein Cas7/Cse4/CasC [Candidatus Thermoplasmatota archaeon]|nr:type I-E CRISPR-associated protein Cas7/Cse4/CasC [Candidatus Thermoplasmatota archaeon]
MTRFRQIHMLTTYPPSNLNRDDSGRPKTAIVGGTTRLRISSQSLKRAWRTSETFQHALAGAIGTRTKRVAEASYEKFVKAGIKPETATEWVKAITSVFGKPSDDGLRTGQLAHIAPEEQVAVDRLVEVLIKAKRGPNEEELLLLRKKPRAADIAMFGRMLADSTQHNVDAAVQVAHAITVHAVTVEDDYFTAVDDLKPREEDAGAGHVGVHEFGSGVFYSYVCIDTESLVDNLDGDAELASNALGALLEAMATVAPSGKQNSFASRAYANYILVEKGNRQPRSLSVAFLSGIRDGNVLPKAIAELEARVSAFDKSYGPLADERKKLNVESGEGSFEELKKFIQS